MMAMKTCLCLVAIIASLDECVGSWDRRQRSQALVTELPGLSHDIKFKHYSGYLNVSSTHRLHYWFVESQRDPANDPLLLWMNGGPGCSSMEGMLEELGPFKVNHDGKTLDKNPYAWNLLANVIFLEAPAGVGFSYSTDGNDTTGDDLTSAENYAALKKFFSIFPAYRNSELYVGGESYAGVYVPTLVKRILDGNKSYPMNIKGMYIGNGLLDDDLNTDTVVEYAYMHGMLGEKEWNFSRRDCCADCNDFCPFHSARNDACSAMVNTTLWAVWTGGVNPYDIYRDCVVDSGHIYHRALMNGLVPVQFRNVLRSSFKHRNSNEDEEGPPCLNVHAISKYLNNPAVQSALHVNGHVSKWNICNSKMNEAYNKQYTTVKSHFKQAISSGLRVMIYYGDADMACNFLLGQRFAQDLGLDLQSEKKPWHHKKQVAGFWTKYKGLDFLTVKGAGHMVPEWRSGQAFSMMERYLANKPY